MSFTQSQSSSSMGPQNPVLPLESSPFGPDAFMSSAIRIPQTPQRRRTKAPFSPRPTLPPCRDVQCPFASAHISHNRALFFDQLQFPWINALNADVPPRDTAADIPDLSQLEPLRPSSTIAGGPVRRRKSRTTVRPTPSTNRRSQNVMRLDFPLCSPREPRTPSKGGAPHAHQVRFRKLMPLSPFSAATEQNGGRS